MKKITSLLFVFILVSLMLSCEKKSMEQENEKIDWQEQIIYMALTDRFYNGSQQNDEAGNSGCFDPENPFMYHGGDIAGFVEKMDYLKELGITALWTSPLYEQVPRHAINAGRDEERDDTPSCGYHGYVINFRYPDNRGVEPKFGTPDEVKTLIKELKKNNMNIIFDMLVNQAGWNADIVSKKPEWFNRLKDDEKDNKCAYLDLEHMCIYGLPDFKIDDPEVGAEVRNYLNEMSKGWIKEYNIDGIRFDAPMLVPKSYFPEWFREVRSVKKDLFVFAETYDYNRPGNYKPYLERGFDGTLNFYLQGGFKKTFAKEMSTDIIADNMKNTIADLGIEQTRLMVNFIDNHDIARFMTNTDGGPALISDDSRRQHLALIALMTLPGIPQVYYGNELGAYGGYPDNRLDMPGWAWNKDNRTGEHENHMKGAGKTFELTKKLIRIRKSESALTKGNYTELIREDNGKNPNVFGFYREFEDNRVVVVINNSPEPTGEFTIDFSLTGINNDFVCVDILNYGAPEKLEISSGKAEVNMEGKTAGIYLIEK